MSEVHLSLLIVVVVAPSLFALSSDFMIIGLCFVCRLDVCESPPLTYKMCPLCDESLGCHFIDLKNSCMLGKVCDNARCISF